MIRYALGKLSRALLVVLCVSFLTFAMLELTPGSVADTILGQNATRDQIEELERSLGLDRPLLVRYGEWLLGVVTGDLGVSPLTQRSVAETVFTAAGVTFQLVILGTLLALAAAVVSAGLSARWPNGLVDRLGGALTSVSIAVPAYVAGPLLAFVFAVVLGWFLIAGWSPLGDGVGPWLRSITLPVVCIAIAEFATYQRLLRADLIGVLSEPYIDAARTRGISENRIMVAHAFRPSIIPTLTVLGLSIGRMIGGTVIVETMFGIPGMGRIITTAILARDLLVVQGVVLVIAVTFVLINMVVDLVYGVVDPRVRVRETA